MSTDAGTLEKTDALSDHMIGPRAECLNARQDLLCREKKHVERAAQCGTRFVKQSNYRLIGFVGVLLILAVSLCVQLHKLPDTSLSYSLLNAIISLLFNLSSSALLKVFSFLMSLFGLSKCFTPDARLE